MTSSISHRHFDRQSARRSDRAHLQEVHGAPATRFLVMAGARAAIVSSEDRLLASIRWFSRAELEERGISTAKATFLGVVDRELAGYFAVTISDAEAETHAEALKPLVDLRSLVMQGAIVQEDFNLLAQARGLQEWHDEARFCGRCGQATKISYGGWKVSCTGCEAHQFPRVDPVVIMLITKDNANCVLAHEPRFPEKMYSTLAGFVEPGEDIRSAVRRETREEIGIEVGKVEFFGSQPWPFPHSLMVGCIAEGLSDHLVVDRREIAHARWFGRSEVRDMLALKHPRKLFVPSGHAIAHALIRHWAGQET